MTTEINPLTATNKDSSSSPVIGTKRAEINGSAVEEWGDRLQWGQLPRGRMECRDQHC